MGKKMANIFAQSFFAPKLLTSEKRRGRRTRPDFWASLCCEPLKKSRNSRCSVRPIKLK
jgi:hypothetical protein